MKTKRDKIVTNKNALLIESDEFRDADVDDLEVFGVVGAVGFGVVGGVGCLVVSSGKSMSPSRGTFPVEMRRW